MKLNSDALMFLPNARYVVTRTGVKMFCVDNITRALVSLNISEKQKQYNLIEQIWQKGLGKQYV